MKKSIILILLLIISSTSLKSQSLFFEQNKNSVNPNSIVAIIDTIKITAEEFFYNYEFGPAFTKRKDNSKSNYLHFMINEKLLALETYKNRLMNDDQTQNIYSDFISDIATEELFKKEIMSKVSIDNKEIQKIVAQKKCELNIRWLFSKDRIKIDKYKNILKDTNLFDSLFNSQINDSVKVDQREMKTSLFELNKNNSDLAKIVDTIKDGSISGLIKADEGWYIIKVDNKIVNLLSTETEINKLKYEAKEYLLKSKSDSLSDVYVNEILFESKPAIKRDAFNILRSYLGKYILTKELYSEWNLEDKMKSALNNLGLSKNDKYPGIVLITTNKGDFKLEDFIYWYNNREEYIKFNKSDIQEFSKSLENLIWQMLRDKLLTIIAKEKNYFDSDWVKKQSSWWKDKIAYASLRNQYVNSIRMNNKEILENDNENSNIEKMQIELSKKMLHKILELKKKYKIEVNQQILDKVVVSSEEDKKAIDFYTAKKGGLIPRPVFPSIDPDWATWQ
jgi:hypothetical protein